MHSALQIRRLLSLLLVTTAVAAFVGAFAPVKRAANRDFVCYWSAAQLLIHGQNPYDPASVLSLERSAGYVHETALVLRNPPLALTLCAPLGIFGPAIANAIWLFLIISAVALSIHILRPLLFDGDDVYLLGCVFPPVLVCIASEQISPFLLLGLSVFLAMHDRKPFFAGFGLSLCALKPHLLLPFGVAFAIWLIFTNQYRLLSGLIAGVASLSVIPLLFRPAVFHDYASMMQSANLNKEFYPTLSTFFRLSISHDSFWLQFVPAAIACLFAGWFYWTRRNDWQWNSFAGYLLLTLSLLVAPRAWFSDEVLVLPAMLFVLNGRDLARYALYACSLAAIVEIFMRLPMTRSFYVWTTAAWLLCLIATRTAPLAARTSTPIPVQIQH